MKKVEVNCKDFIVHADHVPFRPAPMCSNPSNPAYSDPGDDEEFNAYAVFTPNGEDITSVIDKLDAWDRVTEIALKEFKRED